MEILGRNSLEGIYPRSFPSLYHRALWVRVLVFLTFRIVPTSPPPPPPSGGGVGLCLGGSGLIENRTLDMTVIFFKAGFVKPFLERRERTWDIPLQTIPPQDFHYQLAFNRQCFILTSRGGSPRIPPPHPPPSDFSANLNNTTI